MKSVHASTPLYARRAQRGSVFPMMLLIFGGLLLTSAFVLDSVTLNTDTSQIKRATDAAAMALGRTHPQYKDDGTRLQELAEEYVRANLGLNSAVAENLNAISVTRGTSDQGNATYRVSATLTNQPLMMGTGERDLTVSSTSEARLVSTEVALVLPNTLWEVNGNMEALRRLGKHFAEELIGDSDNTWLALVPYSQAVSVYDSEHPNRPRTWAAPGALNPPELASRLRGLNLASPRIPDRSANLLCMYRGVHPFQNYLWDQPPAGQFMFYYRVEVPLNLTISGFPQYVPFILQHSTMNGVAMFPDYGCPHAPVLPLTNDMSDIDERLDAMQPRFSTNFGIALGWGAMTLAPAFRGSEGWDLEDDLPKDFDDGSNDRIKAVVLLARPVLSSDRDSYNSNIHLILPETPRGTVDTGDPQMLTKRIVDLCTSFKQRRLKFYLIATGGIGDNDEERESSARYFRETIGAGLVGCAEKGSDLIYLESPDFVTAEGEVRQRLDAIVEDLRRQGNFVRLIE